MSRTTNAKTTVRVDVVYRLLLHGLDRARIIELVAKKYPQWEAAPRTIDRYIAKAKVLIDQAGQYDRDEEFGRALASLFDLYSLARQKGNVRDALAVRKEINELLGLKAPTAVEHSGTLQVITPDAVEAEIARLEAQFAASE